MRKACCPLLTCRWKVSSAPRHARRCAAHTKSKWAGVSEHAYRLAVFDKRITKFEPINIQLKDAQFLESIDATDRDVCNFFGLPEHMPNRGKEAYNSNEQKYIEYLVGTLDAFLVPWEQGARIRWLSAAEQANT